MAFVTPEQAAQLATSTVRIATLGELRFASQTLRVWNGAGTITVAGYDWSGLHTWAGFTDIPDIQGTASASVTATLSGVDPLHVALARNNVTDVRGRLALFWLQLFDAEWQPVGARIPLWWGTMQRVVINRTSASEDAGGEISVGVEIENPYAGRARSAAGRYTDSDQQHLYPGDRFCRFVSDQASTTLTWPDY